MNTQDRLDLRNATQLIHGHHNTLQAVPADVLNHVAKGFAKSQNIKQKTMLKAMARYTRLYRS